ncbi:hypothetical protein AOZ06_08375 [Kibdelosporangium phytohabitans]|uniref:Uncharacterized protein n=1 Tax=Kibdelosporangium phytohabitans TaxID=860235 RepID=A0A0N9HU06_9PSEU|nr:hypothetical protein AOZ06_08375 [Kibdelosporangium phytohabitans]
MHGVVVGGPVGTGSGMPDNDGVLGGAGRWQTGNGEPGGHGSPGGTGASGFVGTTGVVAGCAATRPDEAAAWIASVPPSSTTLTAKTTSARPRDRRACRDVRREREAGGASICRRSGDAEPGC